MVNRSEPAFKGNIQAGFKNGGRNAPENAPRPRKWRGPIGAKFLRMNGAGNRDRTGDIQLGKLAFYR
jgi:hypothetical protein